MMGVRCQAAETGERARALSALFRQRIGRELVTGESIECLAIILSLIFLRGNGVSVMQNYTFSPSIRESSLWNLFDLIK